MENNFLIYTLTYNQENRSEREIRSKLKIQASTPEDALSKTLL